MKTGMTKIFFKQRHLTAAYVALFAVAAALSYFLPTAQDKTAYILSLIIILAPTSALVVSQKPSSRRTLAFSLGVSALAAVGRILFSFIPQVKPLAAIVILSGAALGPCAGFTVGAVSVFSSNFYFGQGPWTPLQMFGFGVIGFLAGIIFYRRNFSKLSLYLYGLFATFFIYGGIINTLSFFMFCPTSWAGFCQYLIMSLPMDLIHALSTLAFMIILTPLIGRYIPSFVSKKE